MSKRNIIINYNDSKKYKFITEFFVDTQILIYLDTSRVINSNVLPSNVIFINSLDFITLSTMYNVSFKNSVYIGKINNFKNMHFIDEENTDQEIYNKIEKFFSLSAFNM